MTIRRLSVMRPKLVTRNHGSTLAVEETKTAGYFDHYWVPQYETYGQPVFFIRVKLSSSVLI